MPLKRAPPRPDLLDEAREPLQDVRDAIAAGSADRLVALLDRETDPFVREAALTSLARIKADFAVETLVELLQAEDVALRNAAIELLGNMGERAVDAIEPLLGGDDPNGRIYALNALEGADSPRAAAIALRVALRDSHVNVCAAAVEVVARCGAPDMAAALKAVALRFPEHPFLAFAVRAALQKIG